VGTTEVNKPVNKLPRLQNPLDPKRKLSLLARVKQAPICGNTIRASSEAGASQDDVCAPQDLTFDLFSLPNLEPDLSTT
jgi:hypothetical protein